MGNIIHANCNEMDRKKILSNERNIQRMPRDRLCLRVQFDLSFSLMNNIKMLETKSPIVRSNQNTNMIRIKTNVIVCVYSIKGLKTNFQLCELILMGLNQVQKQFGNIWRLTTIAAKKLFVLRIFINQKNLPD